MNVCFVLISRGWGGGENVARQMLSYLVMRDIKVSLILNNEMKEFFEDLDLEIIDLGCLYDSKSLIKMIINPKKVVKVHDSHPIKGLNVILMYLYFHRVGKKIMNSLKARNIEIVHTHLEYSDIMGNSIFRGKRTDFDDKKDIKWVMNIHGPWFSMFYDENEFSFVAKSIFSKLLGDIFKSTDKAVFVSKYLEDQAREAFPSENWDLKGQVIHNGIDLTKTKDLLKNKNISRTGKTDLAKHDFSTIYTVKDGFNILFPGGPKLKKGGDILIKALKQAVTEIPDLNLYIALDVPEDHLIRGLVKDYGLEKHVNFVGFLKTREYMSLLSRMDLLAMPSRMEPFGMVYLEAMSLGVPIIASNVGGGVEIVKNERNGLLASPEPGNVASAIIKLYNDPDLREKMSENNLEDIRKFSWDNIIEKYLDVYKNLKKIN